MASSWKSSMRRSSVWLFLLFGYLSTVCSGMEIVNISVPQTYVLDRNQMVAPAPLVLDCDFESNALDTGIVVKWLFNNFPVYQWIPGSNPVGLLRFKPHVDTAYTVNQDPKEMYRAMSITNPTWNMTGNYTCSVQSFRTSDQQSAQLIVIEPEKEFDMEVESDEENLIINCRTAGIFPKPRLTINLNDRHVPGKVTDNENTRQLDSLYEVNVTVSINRTLIEVPAQIKCILEIPRTEYIRERTFTYNEVTTTTTTAQTLTYKDGESDDTYQISRLKAVVASPNERRDSADGAAATTIFSTAVILLSTIFLRNL